MQFISNCLQQCKQQTVCMQQLTAMIAHIQTVQRIIITIIIIIIIIIKNNKFNVS